MKIAEKPTIDVLLTTKNPYKNIYSNEIKYLDISEWMIAESKSKQELLLKLTDEALAQAQHLTPEEFNDLLNKYYNHLNKLNIWEILEDKPSLRILYGKKET